MSQGGYKLFREGLDLEVEPRTFVDVLRMRASELPDQIAYTFLADGETEEAAFTYRDLDRRARAIGAKLQSLRKPGDRILLIYHPSLEYVAAFLGCLYAGMVAVPAYPPRLNRKLSRLQAIVEDAEISFALTVDSILSGIRRASAEIPFLRNMEWAPTDKYGADLGSGWREPAVNRESIALLQYTSGSTGAPKGVALTHENLLYNSSLLAQAFRYNRSSHCVSWLPAYHDMGLIGGVLQPLYGGFRGTFMSPAAFLQRPLRWLQAISRYNATISGGPNFAYELCVARISEQQKESLDLSKWTVAFCGAEPVRVETLDRFSSAFAVCGFNREALSPCYGLAEATLIVSGGRESRLPRIKSLPSDTIKEGLDGASIAPRSVRNIVSCGNTLPGQQIIIVDPRTMTRCEDDVVGEIWVSGPSVAKGYFNRAAETDETFRAQTAEAQKGAFLRTGDLGFLSGGELFVTGRLKDLIIIRGVNHYPQDVEYTVENSHPALRPNCCAAFSINVDGQERLVVVAEVVAHFRREPETVIEQIRRSVVEEHDAPLYSLCLIKTGSIPKTSSGKIRRQTCRAHFLEGELKILAQWTDGAPKGSFHLDYEEKVKLSDVNGVERWLASLVAAKVKIGADDIDLNQPVAGYGLDSLGTTELAHTLQTTLGVSIPATMFYQDFSLKELAELAFKLQRSSSAEAKPRPQEEVTEFRLSRGQQALYFIHQLETEAPIHNLIMAGRVRGELGVTALRRAFQRLIDRHQALRANFFSTPTGPMQIAAERMEVCFQEVDARLWTDEELNGRTLSNASRRFDLENDPLLRITLYQRDDDWLLLIVVHHLVVNLWSLGLLLKDLGRFYLEEGGGRVAAPTPPAPWFSDFVDWQEHMLSGEEGGRLRRYWADQLSGHLPALDMPTDRPRPAKQTHNGDSHSFKIEPHLVRELERLNHAYGVTLFTSLAALFESFLYRYTGLHDILLGTLAHNRGMARFADVVGYFVNPIVLRGTFFDDPSFASFLTRMKHTVLGALSHQAYPFALLVEDLQPVRSAGYSPLIQTMLVFQMANFPGLEKLAQIAVGHAGGPLNIGGLELESASLSQNVAQFDLTLKVTAAENGIVGSLEYNSDLFERTTITRMLEHFLALIEGAVYSPELPISGLPIVRKAELEQLIYEWNRTELAYPEEKCIHTLIEEQVGRTPDARVICFAQEQLTYDELNARANQLAHYLAGLGVVPEARVGICIERSIEMVVGLIGILKAGGSYVPLDPLYPRDRISLMINEAGLSAIITQQRLRSILPSTAVPVVCLDLNRAEISRESRLNPQSAVCPDNLSYIIFTSGSTGKPKGVMVSHRNVNNFFHAMGSSSLDGRPGRWLAVTSVSFDISVLELLWTLTRGFCVIIHAEQDHVPHRMKTRRYAADQRLDFSLFYFASDDREEAENKYQLLLEGAKFADDHGFSAVWTPERHFHSFGGLYPNPSVTGAAVAAITKSVNIRAGSVVLPLHNPIRVVEEWSVVDNISKGRAGISVASGWHADDFVLAPDNYADRRELMLSYIEKIRKLWRGESISFNGGGGNEIEVRIFPKPIQKELPLWVTAAGSEETFRIAGEIGANLLTHLLGQTLEELAGKISTYRKAREAHGHGEGYVTLMVHTFIGDDLDEVRAVVKEPFCAYLRNSYGLIKNLARSLGMDFGAGKITQGDMDALLAHAFDRYFYNGSMMGAANSVIETIERIKEIGVNEVACLIDFGVDNESVLYGLNHLAKLRRQVNETRTISAENNSASAQIDRHAVTHMQCTPSMVRMLSLEGQSLNFLEPLEKLLIGGESLPPTLAREIRAVAGGEIYNMYGPTETTIWSTAGALDRSNRSNDYRPSDREYGGLHPESPERAGADRRGRRTLHRRSWGCSRLC